MRENTVKTVNFLFWVIEARFFYLFYLQDIQLQLSSVKSMGNGQGIRNLAKQKESYSYTHPPFLFRVDIVKMNFVSVFWRCPRPNKAAPKSHSGRVVQ